MRASISENKKSVKQKITKNRISDRSAAESPRGSPERGLPAGARPGSFFRASPGLGPLPRPGGRLGPHPLDLAPRQGDADLADPFQLYAIDWLGIEAREVDRIGRFAALDSLQVALAGLQPHHRLLAEEARKRVPLVSVNHDNVAVFVFGQHRIAGYLKSDGLSRDRERELDLTQPLGGDLLVFRL